MAKLKFPIDPPYLHTKFSFDVKYQTTYKLIRLYAPSNLIYTLFEYFIFKVHHLAPHQTLEFGTG